MKRLATILFLLLISASLYSQNNQVVVFNAKISEIGWSNNVILFPNGRFIAVMKQDLVGGHTYGYWNQYDNILELKGYPKIGNPVDITATRKYNPELEESTAIYLDKEYPIMAECNGKKYRFFPFKGAAYGEFLPFRAEKIWVECGILPHMEEETKGIELYDSIHNRYDNVVIINVDDTHTIQNNPYRKYIILDSCTIYELGSGTKYTRRDSVSAERYLKQALTKDILNTIDKHCRENSSIINHVAYDTDTTVPNITRFMIKYEKNRCRLDRITITKNVAEFLTNQQTLDCEDEYILLINYLNGECHDIDISRMIYNTLLRYPKKMDLLDHYIGFLPTNEQESTKENLLILLATEHSRRVTMFRKEEFQARFPITKEYGSFIVPEISRHDKYATGIPDINRIDEIIKEIEKEMINGKLTTLVREIFQNAQTKDIPTFEDKDYAMMILYWIRNLTEYSNEIDARLYETLYLYPLLAEQVDMILANISCKKREDARKNFARSITIEHSKQQTLFLEDIFYLKFPIMEQYKEVIKPVIEEADKKYLNDIRESFGT